MTLPDWFLLSFAVGTLWSIAGLILGGLHLGHSHSGHFHFGHGPAAHGPAHALHAAGQPRLASTHHNHSAWGNLLHPSSLSAFFAWFGGVGYVLTRHTGWRFWIDILAALVAGFAGAWILSSFLRLLQSQDRPLDPADYQMVGVLGRVNCPIRPGGVGELIFIRDGARTPVPARSEDGRAIGVGEEVIVTHFDRGIASVRTWAAMVPQSPSAGATEKTLQKEDNNV